MTSAILTMFSHRPAVEEEYARGDEIEAISLHGSTDGGEAVEGKLIGDAKEEREQREEEVRRLYRVVFSRLPYKSRRTSHAASLFRQPVLYLLSSILKLKSSSPSSGSRLEPPPHSADIINPGSELSSSFLGYACC